MLFYEQQMLIELQQKELERRARDAWRFMKQPEMTKVEKLIEQQPALDCCICPCEA